MNLGNAVIVVFWVVIALVAYAVLAMAKHAIVSFMRLFKSKPVVSGVKTTGLPSLVADKAVNDVPIISGLADRLKPPIVGLRTLNESTDNRYGRKVLINDPLKPLLKILETTL